MKLSDHIDVVHQFIIEELECREDSMLSGEQDYIANAHAAERSITEAREIGEALALTLGNLAREATGFVEMAAIAAHGHTNVAVMRQRIDDAFAAIAKAEGRA